MLINTCSNCWCLALKIGTFPGKMGFKMGVELTWSPSIVKRDGWLWRKSVRPSWVVPTAFLIGSVKLEKYRTPYKIERIVTHPLAPNWHDRSWIVRLPFFCIRWSIKNSSAMFLASSIFFSFFGLPRRFNLKLAKLRESVKEAAQGEKAAEGSARIIIVKGPPNRDRRR